MQYRLRTLLMVITAIAVTLAVVYQWHGLTGRYQLITAPRHARVQSKDEMQEETEPSVFLFDSATGRVWHRSSSGKWKQETPSDLAR